MRKNKVILAAVIALSIATTGAGCGNNAVNNQKAVAESIDKKAENPVSVSDTVVSEEPGQASEEKEVETITDEKEAAQTVVAEINDANTSDADNSSNGNSSSDGNNNSGSNTGNSAGNSTGNTPSGNNTGNGNSGSSGNTGNSGSTSPSGNSSTGGNTNSGSGSDTNTNAGGGNTPVVTPTPQPQHQHDWVHHDAIGHYETVIIQEAWDEEVLVYEDVAHDICNVCGADITGNTTEHSRNHALAYEGSGWHTEWRYEQTGTQKVHHDAVTEQRWVEDAAAYDQCSTCGAIK